MAKAKTSTPKIPLKGAAPAPVSQSPEDILNDLLPTGNPTSGQHEAAPPANASPPAREPAAPAPFTDEEPDVFPETIELGADAFADMVPAAPGVMSDEEPEGFEPNPPADPDAREQWERERIAKSLRDDAAHAARVSGAQSQNREALRRTEGNFSAGTGNTGSTHVPSRPPAEVRRMLAEAQKVQPSKWRSRIAVGMAYQYNGELHKAPEFIDRNWAAYDNGPALNIPGAGIVRRGQWVVVQNVLNEDDTVAHSEIKVYDDAVFRSLFVPDKG